MKDWKDNIIEDYKETVDRLLKESEEKSEFIFKLMEGISQRDELIQKLRNFKLK